ncbi:MAG: hypothetical protein ABUT20_46700 [Bacteroidota bacterium]
MTSELLHPESVVAGPELSLHNLTDKLIISLLPKSTKQKNIIINDISEELTANADEQLLAAVMGCLLQTAVAHASSSCIRVSAKAFGYITLVHIRSNEVYNEEISDDYMRRLQPLAEKLGGCITVTNSNLRGTTMAFTFINPATFSREAC